MFAKGLLLVNVGSGFSSFIGGCKSWLVGACEVVLNKCNNLVSLLYRWVIKGRAMIKRFL